MRAGGRLDGRVGTKRMIYHTTCISLARRAHRRAAVEAHLRPRVSNLTVLDAIDAQSPATIPDDVLRRMRVMPKAKEGARERAACWASHVPRPDAGDRTRRVPPAHRGGRRRAVERRALASIPWDAMPTDSVSFLAGCFQAAKVKDMKHPEATPRAGPRGGPEPRLGSGVGQATFSSRHRGRVRDSALAAPAGDRIFWRAHAVPTACARMRRRGSAEAHRAAQLLELLPGRGARRAPPVPQPRPGGVRRRAARRRARAARGHPRRGAPARLPLLPRQLPAVAADPPARRATSRCSPMSRG